MMKKHKIEMKNLEFDSIIIDKMINMCNFIACFYVSNRNLFLF